MRHRKIEITRQVGQMHLPLLIEGRVYISLDRSPKRLFNTVCAFAYNILTGKALRKLCDESVRGAFKFSAAA